jgi:hypothetical protein
VNSKRNLPMFNHQPLVLMIPFLVSVFGVFSFSTQLAAQEKFSWKCPACDACAQPLRARGCEIVPAKKTTTNYSCKIEDVCFSSPDPNQNRVSKFVACHLPATWQAWCEFTGGVVREKRTLEKLVETKEVDTHQCAVFYQCPCCGERFKPKSQ